MFLPCFCDGFCWRWYKTPHSSASGYICPHRLGSQNVAVLSTMTRLWAVHSIHMQGMHRLASRSTTESISTIINNCFFSVLMECCNQSAAVIYTFLGASRVAFVRQKRQSLFSIQSLYDQTCRFFWDHLSDSMETMLATFAWRTANISRERQYNMWTWLYVISIWKLELA